MLNDVTFGQFYPTQSFVHKLDPRIKLLGLIAFIVLLFVANNFYSLLAVALIICIAIAAARVPFGRVLRSVKGILVILVFTAVLNLFFHGGEIVYAEWWIIKITREGIIFTVFFILRLFFLVMASSVLTLTTTPVALTDGIESLLKPLKYIKFPVHELALIMSIALRFIPTLIDETNRIISAQKARGADFESGNIFKRIKAIVPILIPLLISAFRRADELGDAMDARCYSSSKNRTKYKNLKLGWRDLVAFLTLAALIAGVVLFNIYCADILPQFYEYIKLS
ncbi:MAG: energy-coupling factor transporter transmembrane protein EcfT [Clostridia bacterium]|nr:energy-coupling factor transporter transmembrane protein EcfT [Clostridia bacterium]